MNFFNRQLLENKKKNNRRETTVQTFLGLKLILLNFINLMEVYFPKRYYLENKEFLIITYNVNVSLVWWI